MDPNRTEDAAVTSWGMALGALAVGIANHIDLVNHRDKALALLSIGIACFVAGIARIGWNQLRGTLAFGLVFVAIADFQEAQYDWRLCAGIAVLGISGLALRPKGTLLVIIAAFIFLGAVTIERTRRDFMDVRVFQEYGSRYLLHGDDPYSGKYPYIFQKGAESTFYGPGVVDADNNLTYGFPYPPISLLMALPSYAITHDSRWADLAAMVLSAILLAMARPGMLGNLVAALFLLTPKTLTILSISWTEPLLILNFSLIMFCACRWRRGLPYALGLFLSTKQYAVLALPLVGLLGETPKESAKIALKACLLAAAIHLPFLLWNFHAFWKSVVLWQFIQPFRDDALSFSAWIYLKFGWKLPIWISLLVIIPAYSQALRRAARTPAGFAAGVALVSVVFFAFNKQAFCNYYFFSIAAAWWAVAAAGDSSVIPKKV